MKVALVHDFLTQYGGAERVLEAFLEIWPEADVYTAVYDSEKTFYRFDKYHPKTSFIQKFPFGVRKYKWYLPFLPRAYRSFNLTNYDLVISDASGLVKGINVPKNTPHICFLHTPTRYLWSDRLSYWKTAPIPFFIKPFMPKVLAWLQKVDLEASKNPKYYIVNSKNVAQRLKKYYHRQANAIITPPVDTKRFIPTKPKNYYLIVGRQEPYKKTDLGIKAFNELGFPLKVAGGGSRVTELQALAKKNIEFVGRISDDRMAELYAGCLALIFIPEEDAGIVPLEAMACGRPVLAYKAGGVLEVMKEGITGEYFIEQTSQAIIEAVKKFKWNKYDPKLIRQHAYKFDKEIFKKKIIGFVKSHSQSEPEARHENT